MRYFIITLVIVLLTACAPSESAIQTSIAATQASYTSTPESTPTPTIDPISYINEYSDSVQLWLNGYKRVLAITERIAVDGWAIREDEEFQLELKETLASFEQAAKDMADLKPPPGSEYQWFQDRAVGLQKFTELFADLFSLGIATGDVTNLRNASAPLHDAIDIIQEISDKLKDKGITLELPW